MGAPVPSSFPIFPLPDCVLFPDVELGLHIFEPRYRALTQAALEGDGVIGMMLIRPGEDARAARARVFAIGCAGRIVRSVRLASGRFQLELAGARRFRILAEDAQAGGFRLAHVELLRDPRFEDLAPDVRHRLEGLRAVLHDAVLHQAPRTRAPAVRALAEGMSALDPVQLVHAIAFGLAIPEVEKQGLLEAPDIEQRAEMLRALLEIRRAERTAPPTPRGVH
ncbi:MAG: LON peptidase substrate-binding domain-containing protein [Myxococcota bacterium]